MTSLKEFSKKHKISMQIIASVLLAVLIYAIYFDSCHFCLDKMSYLRNKNLNAPDKLKKYWMFGYSMNYGNLNNFLKTLKRFGYQNALHAERWDLMWANDNPFKTLRAEMKILKNYQRVNHFPGYRTFFNIYDFANSDLRYIPRTFKLPEDEKKFLQYAGEHPEKMFLWKDDRQLEIIKNVSNASSHPEFNLAQELIDNPDLNNNYMYDVGVHVVITSMDPLRIYVYKGDVSFRSASAPYTPFNSSEPFSYITSSNGLIDVEGLLQYYYEDLDYNIKDSLNAIHSIRETQPDNLWNQTEDAIVKYIFAKKSHIMKHLRRFKSQNNFFEMLRFNFLIDNTTNVHLLSVQTVPNLSKPLFHWNERFQDQMLYNFFGLIGIAPKIDQDTLAMTEDARIIQSYDTNIGVFPDECLSEECSKCTSDVCKLCKKCLRVKEDLLRAHSEHLNKGDCGRIFPKRLDRFNPTLPEGFETFSENDRLSHLWFQGKCMLDSSWCQ